MQAWAEWLCALALVVATIGVFLHARACRARWGVLCSLAGQVYALLDAHGRIVEISPHFLRFIDVPSAFGLRAWLMENPQLRDVQAFWAEPRPGLIYEQVFLSGSGRALRLRAQTVFNGRFFSGHVLVLEDAGAHEALRQSESRFRTLFQSIPVLASISEVETGRFVELNPLWTFLLGYSREETLGRTSLEMGLWAFPAERQRFVSAVLNDGMVSNMRASCRRKDGALRLCELAGSLIEFEGRHCLLLLLRDVTEQDAAAQALALSEQKFRMMFDHSCQFASLLSPDGLLLDGNRTAQQFSGVPIQAVQGIPFWDCPWWRQDPGEKARLQGLIARAAAGESCRCELTHPDPKGGMFFVDFSLKPIWDEAGVVCMLLAEGHDVTELHRAGQALLQSNARFEIVFRESMAAMLVSRLADYVIVDANRACLKLFEWSEESVIGRSCIELGLWVDVRDRQHVEELLLEGDGVFSGLEVWWQTGTRQKKRCLLSARRVRIDEADCLIWDVFDVTAQRAMEHEIREFNNRLEARVEARTVELARANRELTATLATLEQAQDELIRADKLASLGALVAGITHELNTPLGNSITVASSLQSRAQEFAAQFASGLVKKSDLAEFLDFSENGSDLLMRSLTQARELVTSFKQVAVDQASSQRRQFDLAELVREVLRTMHPTLRKAKTKVEVQSELEDELLLDSYPGPLGQVITNFITNALLHGFENCETGVLKITAHRLNENRLEFVFADNGHGIPQEIIGKIFDPFFTTKLGRGGSGLGLHIAHGIVTRILGGQLQVESVPEEGTTFRIIIPVIAPEEESVSAG